MFVIISWTWYIVVCVCHTHFRDRCFCDNKRSKTFLQVTRTGSSRPSLSSNNCSRQVSLSPETAEKKHSIRDQSIEEVENNNEAANGHGDS